MLSTIERALATSILPSAANVAAKEEASLAILFTRWIRAVVDDAASAERISYRDCRTALNDISGQVESLAVGASGLAWLRESRISALAAEALLPAELRHASREIKALLGRALRALRSQGHAALANEVRARLYDLGALEIERERAFGRASMMDPGWRSIPSLADLGHSDKQPRRQTI
jgi:hypothetical protein